MRKLVIFCEFEGDHQEFSPQGQTVKEKYKLSVFEDTVLIKIFGPMGVRVTGR